MTARTYRYLTCDVFTERRFGGNPLAVVLDAQGLDDAAMQTIAREFNYSETTFVLPPTDPRHTARVRIFTPGGELPFAGHPTVGTAFVLATLGIVPAAQRDIVFEEGVGPVPVRIDRDGATVTRCTLTAARLPERGPAAPPREAVAAMLNLPPTALTGEAEAWSCGVPFLVVPLASVDALARCKLDMARWEATLSRHAAHKVYPVAPVDAQRWRVRMFAPGIGVPEDPATGSAAASFAGWLAQRHGAGAEALRYTLLQGQEVGRPSELALEIDLRDGRPTAVRVGGAAVAVCEGVLWLD